MVLLRSGCMLRRTSSSSPPPPRWRVRADGSGTWSLIRWQWDDFVVEPPGRAAATAGHGTGYPHCASGVLRSLCWLCCWVAAAGARLEHGVDPASRRGRRWRCLVQVDRLGVALDGVGAVAAAGPSARRRAAHRVGAVVAIGEVIVVLAVHVVFCLRPVAACRSWFLRQQLFSFRLSPRTTSLLLALL